MSNVVIIDFDSADALWDYLSPTRRSPRGEYLDSYYRGHADTEWKLIPSVLRYPSVRDVSIFTDGYRTPPVAKEMKFLSDFARYCDKIGISIPNDSTTFRWKYLNPVFTVMSGANQEFTFPEPQLYEIMAMAQHHSVFTRLLDWSTNPYVAAYFAASGAISRHEDNGWAEKRLCLWICSINSQTFADSLKPLNFITVAGSISKHIVAQRGVFSVHPYSAKVDYTGEELPQSLDDMDSIHTGYDFKKLTLPYLESVRLLHLCEISGFSAVELFPSADGAGLSIREDIIKQKIILSYGLAHDGILLR
ncbi:FRG domain-containing protein [Pantoea endophytica]